METLEVLQDDRALQHLIESLNDHDTEVRIAAAGALGKIGDKKAINPLMQRLNDPDETENVRIAVLRSLGSFDDPRIIDVNIKMLQDKSPYVKWYAVLYIIKKPDKKAGAGEQLTSPCCKSQSLRGCTFSWPR